MSRWARLRAAALRRIRGPYLPLAGLDARVYEIQQRLAALEEALAMSREALITSREALAVSQKTRETTEATHRLLADEMRPVLRALAAEESANRRRLHELRVATRPPALPTQRFGTLRRRCVGRPPRLWRGACPSRSRSTDLSPRESRAVDLRAARRCSYTPPKESGCFGATVTTTGRSTTPRAALLTLIERGLARRSRQEVGPPDRKLWVRRAR